MENKSGQRLIRCLPEEKESARYKAEFCGLTLSNFVRTAALGETPHWKMPADFYQLRRELYAVLNNLTQMSRVCNANGQPLQHPAIKPPPGEDGKEHKFFRLYKFAPGYTEEDIVRRLEEKERGAEEVSHDFSKAAPVSEKTEQAAPPQNRRVDERPKPAVWWTAWEDGQPMSEPKLYTYSGVWLTRTTITRRSRLYHNYFLRRDHWWGFRKLYSMFRFSLKSVEPRITHSSTESPRAKVYDDFDAIEQMRAAQQSDLAQSTARWAADTKENAFVGASPKQPVRVASQRKPMAERLAEAREIQQARAVQALEQETQHEVSKAVMQR